MKDKNAVLSDVIKGYRGISYKPWQLKSTVDNDTAILLRSNNIKDGRLNFNDVQYVPKSIVDENQTLKKGDLVVCMSNGSKDLVGKNATFNIDSNFTFTIGAFCSVFKPKSGATIEYVRHLFSDNNYKKHIDLILAGSAINNLRNTQIEELKCYIPDYPIQQKIAKILSTIDGQIEKTEAIIAKYQAVKQGMLQDLFTRGIDITTGKLRPKYEDAPELYKDSPLGMIPREWEVVRLENSGIEILDGDRGANYPNQDDFNDFGYCLFLSATNVTKDGFKFDTVQFISEGKDNKLGNGKLKRGDIIVTTRGTVGNVVFYDSQVSYDNIRINSGMIILRNSNSNINIQFLFHYAKDFLFEIEYKKSLSGSAQPQLPIKELKSFPVIIMKGQEQNDIARKIDSLKSKIKNEQLFLSKSLLLKQGLMSDLLSGKVEVTE